MRRALVLALACGGCDVLFKLDTVPLHADGAPIADGIADGIDEGSNTPNLVFVSSQKIVPGMLGTVDAADAKCEALAAAAGHPGRYVAWLSSSISAAPTRIGGARGWIRADGRPFADTLPNIIQGRIWYPIRLTESGDDVAAGGDAELVVATGTDANGAPSPNTCSDFTNATASQAATAGLADNAPFGWTSFMGTLCNTPAHLYCFGIDHAVPVTLVPETTHRAFVSESPLPANGGIASFDQECKAEAAEWNLVGNFSAAVSTTQASALSRFAAGGPWLRIDGVTAIDTSGAFVAPLELDASTTLQGPLVAWNGATSLAAASSTAADSCFDWTRNDTTMGLTGNDTRSGPDGFGGLPNPCNNQLHVYCLEQ